MNFNILLYAVTDRSWTEKKDLYQQVEEALKAGVTLVQLREKELEENAFLEEAKKMKALTDTYGIPLIINDNLTVALESGAAGVHIGQEDLDVGAARLCLGPEKILGVTAKTVEQAQKAQAQGADYLGSGAVFGSFTKTNAKSMSLEQLKAITRSVQIPVVAIGGIYGGNVMELAGTGVSGVAVVSGIFAQPSIESAVLDLKRKAGQIRGGGNNG